MTRSVTATSPTSLGEQFHDSSYCQLDGLPHPGPCVDPDRATVGDLLTGDLDDRPVRIVAGGPCGPIATDGPWLTLVSARRDPVEHNTVWVTAHELPAPAPMWSMTPIQVGTANVRISVDVTEATTGDRLPTYGWTTVLHPVLAVRYADAVASVRMQARRRGGRVRLAAHGPVTGAHDSAVVTVSALGAPIAVYHGGPAGGVTDDGVSRRTLPGSLWRDPTADVWHLDDLVFHRANAFPGFARDFAAEELRAMTGQVVTRWVHHADRYGVWFEPLFAPSASGVLVCVTDADDWASDTHLTHLGIPTAATELAA